MTLLGYIALTAQPLEVKQIIPFKMHGKIDPFNVGQFALQSFLKPFREYKKALAFHIGFTLIAGAVVALTNWNGKTAEASV